MVVIITGTTGSGKTTIGTLLARRLAWEFADADEFHPPANIAKMSRGIPLTDEDRAPWLGLLRDKISEWLDAGRDTILACSALKQRYREKLVTGPKVRLVYLKGGYALFAQRVNSRKGHFAKEDILAGQFRDLEEPTDAVTVDAGLAPAAIVSEICHQLGLA